jgi:hypothetical protein
MLHGTAISRHSYAASEAKQQRHRHYQSKGQAGSGGGQSAACMVRSPMAPTRPSQPSPAVTSGEQQAQRLPAEMQLAQKKLGVH